jgi:hypothetical protein
MMGINQYLTRDKLVSLASAGTGKNSARAVFVNSPIGTNTRTEQNPPDVK